MDLTNKTVIPLNFVPFLSLGFTRKFNLVNNFFYNQIGNCVSQNLQFINIPLSFVKCSFYFFRMSLQFFL
ncbi:unnamed protein product [Prunus brigantina]